MYDAIVVGARCAGSPTAMLLARAGYKVLLLDRATFPSDTLSTQIIWSTGLSRLKRWGLLDKLVATGCPRIDSPIAFHFGPLRLEGTPTAYEGLREAYAPRRTILDKILIDAAREAGAEVREDFSVRELAFDGDRVTGIRGQGNGNAVEEQARVVIGADGLHSMVARAVSPATYNEKATVGCYYYSYWAGQLAPGMSAWIGESSAAVAIPTHGATLILNGYAINRFHEVRTDIPGNFMKTCSELAPELAEKMRASEQTERFNGIGEVPGYYRKPYGPGWVLVGDAGYHKDPTTAQGISDSFRDAENLAGGLDAALSGKSPFEDAMAEYERVRNEETGPLYEFTFQLASFEPPPPEMLQLLGALSGNRPQTDRFFGMYSGTLPVQEFFAPESIGEIMAGAHQGAA